MTSLPDEQTTQLVAGRLLEMADDELILSHRNSEWTGHAPILEEDIAFANIAQDEMGHALIWYELLRSLTGRDPDRLVFFREPCEYRNLQMVELPKGDWAFTVLRQYLFDTWEAGHLEALEQSRFTPVAEAAQKIGKEERYHLRHTAAWLCRLGRGTEESNSRMQAALDQLWPFHSQIWAAPPDYERLVTESLMPDLARLGSLWEDRVRTELSEAGLTPPGFGQPSAPLRDEHTEHLQPLIEEMQQVARLETEAGW
ncbi:MAG: phenylacetate-CoA oxygenase subunit PaaI [Acidobacteria bacterium]|nr:MAG: phenylacetate-CoA oxygenase subunit PaaI [Acidobacteriota bacterium]